MFTRLAPLFATAALCLTVGCGATKPAVSVASSTTPTVHPVSINEAQVLVSQEILSRCPNVQEATSRPYEGPATEAWLSILGSVAKCTNDGGLGYANVQVTGAEHSSDAATVVLTRFGVESSRLRPVATMHDGYCAETHQCALSTVKITLADTSDQATATETEQR